MIHIDKKLWKYRFEFNLDLKQAIVILALFVMIFAVPVTTDIVTDHESEQPTTVYTTAEVAGAYTSRASETQNNKAKVFLVSGVVFFVISVASLGVLMKDKLSNHSS